MERVYVSSIRMRIFNHIFLLLTILVAFSAVVAEDGESKEIEKLFKMPKPILCRVLPLPPLHRRLVTPLRKKT
ncbi:unnamed protein product [Cylicocyclus nassatus]|uniref:Transmembrane protein n=1 Tax=Cylicocyclus nassatus TaxID=53992 RepID=A0AA36MEF4_CYLNA|nr:unnamed protein product [Cylicocyclus nassatus]